MSLQKPFAGFGLGLTNNPELVEGYVCPKSETVGRAAGARPLLMWGAFLYFYTDVKNATISPYSVREHPSQYLLCFPSPIYQKPYAPAYSLQEIH